MTHDSARCIKNTLGKDNVFFKRSTSVHFLSRVWASGGYLMDRQPTEMGKQNSMVMHWNIRSSQIMAS